MSQMRCPYHDVVFETETDHSKPGTRILGSDNKPTGKHKHPQYKGGISGHTDCPLCQKGILVAESRGDDPNAVVASSVRSSSTRRIA
jgi:hypothetical protein